MSEADRFTAAMMAIDGANAEDPERVTIDGAARPKELVHAEVVQRWVEHLDPDADEAQLLAARAHHLRRWVSPRSDFPDGRAGYLRWRTEHKRRQAEEVAQLLVDAGYAQEMVDRVADLVAKRGRGPQAHTHEDALCLAFLELQFGDLADRLGDDRTIVVVRKTAAKMSPAGLVAVGEVSFGPREQRLLAAALGGSDRERKGIP